MQIDEVRAQLYELADRVPSGSVEIDQALRRALRSVRRRRSLVRAGSLVLAVLVVTAGVAAITSGSSPRRHIIVAGPTIVPQVKNAPPISITKDQLEAHDGVGVPRGWEALDEGSARVWVPATWTLQGPYSQCVRQPGAKGIVTMGTLQVACDAQHGGLPFRQIVSVTEPTSPEHGALSRTVHGYRVFSADIAGIDGTRIYDVPALGLEIALRGALSARILGTLAPSSRTVALVFATQTMPASYRRVSTDGVSLSIPRAWIITNQRVPSCSWPESSKGIPELVRIDPNATNIGCSSFVERRDLLPHDGLYLGTSGSSRPEPPGNPRVAVFHHDATTVTVYATQGALDVYARRAGSLITHSIELGLGPDGRTAGAVLASIQARS